MRDELSYDWVKKLIILSYLEPKGMMNERSSANSPHSIRFVWNVTVHDIIITIHTMVPIAENITSGRYKVIRSSE